MSSHLEYLDVREASVEQRMAILAMRNQPNVRKFMYTDHLISEQEHQRWLERIADDASIRAWLCLDQGQPIGLVSLNRIDNRHQTADWAFYLDEQIQGRGYGPKIEYHLLDMAFGSFALEKLNCEVLATNPSTLKLHRRFGFVEEGIRRKNIMKDGVRVDVVLLGILKNEWLAAKPQVTALISRS